MQYTPRYKVNQLTLGTGSTVIVTGWTVAKTVAGWLQFSQYAAIGQLYSPARGISTLCRNLLANPQILDLVVLCATGEDANAQGCHRLRDFWEHGVTLGQTDTGQPAWVIQGAIPGYIEPEIPLEYLTSLRTAVTLHWCNSKAELISTIQALGTNDSAPWHPSPLEFPVKESLPSVFPGQRYGHRIEGKTVAETWVKIIHRIKTTGTIRPTGYDGHWQELIDLMAVVTDEPEPFYFPEPNYLPCDPAFIQGYLPQILGDAPKQEGVKYTYGQRLRSWFGVDQIEQVIKKLNQEIDAASAVMTLWDVLDHERGGSPCLNHIWVRVVAGELSLTALFRSNDMFSAWPANAMGLRALQRHIFERVEGATVLGPLITISQSAHIYDDCWDNADALIRDRYKAPNDFSDPVGNFLVEWVGQEIRVSQTSPQGSPTRQWTGKAPTPLLKKIMAECPGMLPEHAAYLGGEVHRAHLLRDGFRQG